MKLIWVFGSYAAAVAAMTAGALYGASYMAAPVGAAAETETSVPATAAAPPSAPTEPQLSNEPALSNADPGGERLPVWIAPTQVYPASQFKTDHAARSKQQARSGNGRGQDWRLRERQRDELDPESGWSSYGPQAQRERQRPSAAPRYEEPIQFREKTEPR